MNCKIGYYNLIIYFCTKNIQNVFANNKLKITDTEK